jgi:hypothetical protein
MVPSSATQSQNVTFLESRMFYFIFVVVHSSLLPTLPQFFPWIPPLFYFCFISLFTSPNELTLFYFNSFISLLSLTQLVSLLLCCSLISALGMSRLSASVSCWSAHSLLPSPPCIGATFLRIPILEVETACAFETLECMYKTTRCHIPVDCDLHN